MKGSQNKGLKWQWFSPPWIGGRRGEKKKKRNKKVPCGGCCESVSSLLSQEQQLPWLLWRVNLILITQIMSTDYATPACLAVGDRWPPCTFFLFVMCSYIHGTSLDPNLLLTTRVVFQ